MQNGSVELVSWLIERGANIQAPLSVPWSGLAGEEICVCMTSLAFATITGRVDIVKLLLEWGAHRHVLDAKLPELDLTPLELAEQSNHTAVLELIHSTGGSKRPRRQTPVKDRAVKVGLELPPTPAGVREAIEHGSPSKQREAKRKLQRHQKGCHQKVDRAEARAADVNSARSKRFRQDRSQQAMESYWRKRNSKESTKEL